jgi:hypothetical protein
MAFYVPPPRSVTPTIRDLVSAGHLLQRELVTLGDFVKLTHARRMLGPFVEREVWEGWDRDGVLSPLAFYIGYRPHQHVEGQYPLEVAKRDANGDWVEPGWVFRDEVGFAPWTDYEYEQDGFPNVQPLYSEWQLLALPLILRQDHMSIPVTVLAEDDDTIVNWASDSRRQIAGLNRDGRRSLNDAWLPLLKVLLRLQARYWPWIKGRSIVLHQANPRDGDRPTVDPLDREWRNTTATNVRDELGLSDDDVLEIYRWLCRRTEGLDDQPHLRPLTRLLPRRQQEKARGTALQTLDAYDACEMLRRFYRELTGTLLPDADQGYLADPDVEPRPLKKDANALTNTLRRQGLAAHKLHVVVEGETEVRLVAGLFEAFTGRTLAEAGIAITDLEGDKLEQSRRFIEGFGIYARDVALLLDDENEAKRVADQWVRDGVLPAANVYLATPSLEEENFTPDELVAMANQLGSADSITLGFTGADLVTRLQERNGRGGPPLGMASMLQSMAKNPELGQPLTFAKPDLAGPMFDLILDEIRAADGDHDVVAKRRPIVGWVLRFPVRAHRID